MQFTVTPDKDGMMLSRLLLQLADVPQWAVKQALKNRDVRVDGVRVTGDVRVREGQQIRAYWPKEAVASRGQSKPELPIVFENEHVILINKPQGLQAQNDENPLSRQRIDTRHCHEERSRGENRLDSALPSAGCADRRSAFTDQGRCRLRSGTEGL